MHISIRDAYAHKHRPECVRVLADFYWRVLLSIALVILLLSLGYGILELSAVIGEGAVAQKTDVIQPAPKLNKTQLQNTLNAFVEREARFNALKTAAQRIADPSR
ncbi:MAG: hypothetical protein Q7S08_00230 [bacterium]|nr:hypothetical protein [bacterium]